MSEDEVLRPVGRGEHARVFDQELELEGGVVVGVAAHQRVGPGVDERQPADAGAAEGEGLVADGGKIGVDGGEVDLVARRRARADWPRKLKECTGTRTRRTPRLAGSIQAATKLCPSSEAAKPSRVALVSDQCGSALIRPSQAATFGVPEKSQRMRSPSATRPPTK